MFILCVLHLGLELDSPVVNFLLVSIEIGFFISSVSEDDYFSKRIHISSVSLIKYAFKEIKTKF